MNLMSFNTQHCLNYLEQKIDFAIMANTIKKYGADIVGLNEIRDQGVDPDYTQQTAILSELTDIPNFYFAKAIDIRGNNPYGNAILSRFPLVHAETIPIPDPNPKSGKEYYESRCVLKARLENGITVLVTHLGLNHDEQIEGVNTILKHIEDTQCILMGDLNMPPDDDTLLPIRERMIDAAGMLSSSKLSFPSDNPYMKIDYIFVSKDIIVTGADIPAIIASDHRPHTASIDIMSR